MINGLWIWDKFFTDWLFAKWFILFVAGALTFISPLYKKSKILYAYLAWCLLSGIGTYFLDYGADKIIKFKTRPEILYWMVPLLLGIGFLYTASLYKSVKVFTWLFYINALWIIIGTPFGEGYAGIYCNISLSLTLFAILFSFSSAWESTRSLIIHSAIAVVCFYLCHSLMGTVAVVGGVLSVLFLRWEDKRKWLIPPIIALSLGGLVSKEIYDRTKQTPDASFMERVDTAISTSSRVSTWKLAWRSINYTPVRRLTGYGYGSWSSLGMLLQAPKGFQRGVVYNIQMHNDILQIMFEIGMGGFLLWLCLIVDMFRKSLRRKEWWLVYYVVALFISSFGNFPRYLAIEHFVFFLAIKFVYFREEKSIIYPNRNLI